MSDKIELYENITYINGATRNSQMENKTKRRIRYNHMKNPSFKKVFFADKYERTIAIISQQSNDPHVKTICALPNERFFEGDIFKWKHSHWIISEVDLDTDVYYRGTAHWCNVLLRWQNEDGDIIERWCYSSANTSDGVALGNVINLTDGYYKLYLPLDDETKKLKINKRFLIDIDNNAPTAYDLTSVDVISSIFDEHKKHGLIIINVAKSERADDRDNYELMIADYFEKKPDRERGYKSSIEYGDNSNIKAGGYYKDFIPHFYNDNNEEILIRPVWQVTVLDGLEEFFNVKIEDDGRLRIKAQDTRKIVGTQVKIDLYGEDNTAHSELYSKVVNIL